jgi:peptidoglycan/LPS O-acetylase OafA/YrhL
MKENSFRPGGRIPELDGLRGLAILLVIVCHYVGMPDHKPLGYWAHRVLSGFGIGRSGVDLFFVLSGFLIGGILLEARGAPNYFGAFYMRRVFRILPIYYLWTLLFCAMVIGAMMFFPGTGGVTFHDLLRVPVQLLFLQNIFTGTSRVTWTWFAVTWSLAVEEQFYLVAPILVRFLTLRRFVTVLIATVFLAPLLRFVLFHYSADGGDLAVCLMPCRADSLSCGMLVAVAWRNARFRGFIGARAVWLQRTLLILLAGVGALLWWLVHPVNVVTVTIGYTLFAVLYSVLLLTVISNTGGRIAAVMRLRALGWLGGISYCVYLLHVTFNYFAHRVFFHAEPRLYTVGQTAVTLLALLATLAVASLSWRFFEKPLIRRGRRYLYE